MSDTLLIDEVFARSLDDGIDDHVAWFAERSAYPRRLIAAAAYHGLFGLGFRRGLVGEVDVYAWRGPRAWNFRLEEHPDDWWDAFGQLRAEGLGLPAGFETLGYFYSVAPRELKSWNHTPEPIHPYFSSAAADWIEPPRELGLTDEARSVWVSSSLWDRRMVRLADGPAVWFDEARRAVPGEALKRFADLGLLVVAGLGLQALDDELVEVVGVGRKPMSCAGRWPPAALGWNRPCTPGPSARRSGSEGVIAVGHFMR